MNIAEYLIGGGRKNALLVAKSRKVYRLKDVPRRHGSGAATAGKPELVQEVQERT
jgi:hypothetical protein